MNTLNVVVDGKLDERVPTVLIHGVGSDLKRWGPVVSQLMNIGPVIRYDLRGHGDSPKPPGPYTLEDFVSDHLNLMDELGVRRANVAGFSLGGLIGQGIALTAPETVNKLAILSAVTGRTEEQRNAVLERLRLVEEGGPTAVVDNGSRWYTDQFRKNHPEVVEAHMARFEANDPSAYAAAFRVLATTDLIDEIDQITVPTLIMTGDQDVGSPPEMAEKMHRKIAESQVKIINDVKHAVLEEKPEVLANELHDFFLAH